MADTTLQRLIGAAGVGSKVYQITGDAKDGAGAAGYGAWVESITGALPTVLTTEDNRAQIVLSETQAALMRSWLEEKLQSSIAPRPGPPPKMEIVFGPVVKPIALKYIIVFGGIFFLAGFVGRGFMR